MEKIEKIKNFEIHKISQFFEPICGSVKGVCVVCGDHTNKGHSIKFSDNFTAWSNLSAGECVCEYCYSLLKDQQYRRKSWIATKDGVTFLKREDILEVMLDPPTPFAMYLTRSGKKQGFLRIIRAVNYSAKRYFIGWEDSMVFVDIDVLKEMIEVAKKARELKFTKSDLLNPSVKRWKHRDLCKQIMKFKKNLLWEVVVYAIK